MNFRRQLFMLLASMVGFMSVNCQANAESLTINLSGDIADDATPYVLDALKSVEKNGIEKLSFEQGVYHFYPEMAIEKYCYISNHNDELVRIAFDLEDAKDLTIDGGGSTFIFHGRMIPFLVNGGQNIKIENLTIDYADPFHSEATVVATDSENHSLDLQIDERFPYEIRNGQLFFVKPYYYHNLGQNMVYDKERVAPIYQTEEYAMWNLKGVKERYKCDFIYKYKQDDSDLFLRDQGVESSLKAVQLEEGLVRIFGASKKLPPVGSILVSKGDQGTNRFAPAFKVNDSRTFCGENVTVHHAGGMAFLFENCEDVDLYKCKVVPSHGRMVSSTADATHFVGCRGEVSLRDCVFQSQLDDAMNVHGTYKEVMRMIDDHTLGIRSGHYQQLGFRLARVGDKIGVVKLQKSFYAVDTLTVKSVDFVNGRYQTITFDEVVPRDVEVGDLLENLSAYPEVLVEDCDISRNRARGLLISTPRKTTIRNNYFSTEMEAILLPVESGLWYESGNASNVTIEGNTFQDCPNGGMNRGVIRFHTDDKTSNIAFHNIKIVGNTFNHFDNWILELTNIDGFEFSGNTINHTTTFPQQFPNQSVVTAQYCRNLVFDNNIYNGVAKNMVKVGKGNDEINFK